MGNSTKTSPKSKSKSSNQDAKPYDGFPLTAHSNGLWCKKHQGKRYYFGPVEDWKPALALYQHRWPHILDGVAVKDIPPMPGEEPEKPEAADPESGSCTMKQLCNVFLTAKENRVESGELSRHTLAKYIETCATLIDHFGKDQRVEELRPLDFEEFRNKLAKGVNHVTLDTKINRCKIVLKYASKSQLIERAVAFGDSFNRPDDRLMRKARNEAGPRMFEADEIRRILDALEGKPVAVEGKDEPVTLKDEPVLRAMVLLGINCGFGNNDCACLPQSAVDLDKGWIHFPRPKTEVPRHIPLWSETVDVLRKAIAVRPKPKDKADADLVFITNQRNRFVRVQKSKKSPNRYVTINAVARRFESLLKTLGINGRKRLGFYCLRHNFQTVGENSRDFPAVSSIMGHADASMSGRYREVISDERLRHVVDAVHQWLWPDAENTADDDDAVVVAGKVG